MKLSTAPGTINHFNKPIYNNYYSIYSSNYQTDNYRCRLAFSKKNAYNTSAYYHEPYKTSTHQEIYKYHLDNLSIPFNNSIEEEMWRDAWRDAGSQFRRCLDYECFPGPKQPVDNFEMERDGCRMRQVNRRLLVGLNFCQPRDRSCRGIVVPEISIDEAPPIFGEWFDDPNCGNCPPAQYNNNNFMKQIAQNIDNADFGGNCYGQIRITYFILLPVDPRPVLAFDARPGISEGTRIGDFNIDANDTVDCRKIGCYTVGCGTGMGLVNVIYENVGSNTTTFINGTRTHTVDFVEVCVITDEVGMVNTEIGQIPAYKGYLTDAFRFSFIFEFTGSFSQQTPQIPSNSCLFDLQVIKICPPGQGSDYTGTDRPEGGRDRPPMPDRRKPIDESPECMQACSCEQIEAIIAKYMTVQGGFNLGRCDTNELNNFEWSGTGLQSISEAISHIGNSLQLLQANFCGVVSPEIRGGYNLFKCDTATIERFEYEGNGLRGINDQLKAIGNMITTLSVSDCSEFKDIKIELSNLPQKIQIQLSDDIALIIEKLNDILERLPKDDTFADIVRILTLLATLLGLLNDIRSLFEQQKDYTEQLNTIQQLIQELKSLTNPTIQGSVDGIKCDGTIFSNSWDGLGIAGLNQAITAVGVNLAVLHADLCELLNKTYDQTNPPQLQGSVDAIRCDGEIVSNSWDGEGWDGLNQAITALGVNLAVLHADLCELIDDTGLQTDTFQLTDKYDCGDEEITVFERIPDSPISRELRFLYDRLKRIELLICEQEDCNAVPVFPGDTIEEREIPAQAVITFVETKFYPKYTGSSWYVNIPYPIDNLITDDNCWNKFENLIIRKGTVHGRIIWKSPNDTINRFISGIYGHSENETKSFLERIASFSKLTKQNIRITTGGNPRARPLDVEIQAIKVVILERDAQGRMVPTKCCRAPKL